jgi:general stress protein 26
MDTREDARQHLYDLIKDFKTAMLVTRGSDGLFHARPMAVAEMKPDADAYFSTSIASPKIAELEADPRALITFQGSNEFAAIEGMVAIVRDRALIDRLWAEDWRLWFPEGKDDPTLCLLKFSAERGEYWDTSGVEGVRFLFESMKALWQRRQPEHDAAQNAKVDL